MKLSSAKRPGLSEHKTQFQAQQGMDEAFSITYGRSGLKAVYPHSDKGKRKNIWSNKGEKHSYSQHSHFDT